MARAMHRRCCCPPESASPERLQDVLDLVPQGGLAQGAFDQIVHVSLIAVNACSPGDVLVNRLRKRVGLLEDHPDALADCHRIHAAGVQVFSIKEHLALCMRAGDQLIHAVEGPQQG